LLGYLRTDEHPLKVSKNNEDENQGVNRLHLQGGNIKKAKTIKTADEELICSLDIVLSSFPPLTCLHFYFYGAEGLVYLRRQ